MHSTARRSSLEEVRLIPLEPRSRGMQSIHSVIYNSNLSETSTLRKACHIAVKAILAGLCYSQTYGSLEPSRRNFTNKVLQEMFAYGDAFAWGTLSTWCAINLYTHMVEKRQFGSERTINKRTFIAYWTAVIALGIFSEIPAAYTSYYYNGSLFWCIYTPVIASFFAMQSNDELFQKLARSDNFISRWIYRKTNKITITNAQKSFYKSITRCVQSLSINPNFQFQRRIIEINIQETEVKKIVGLALFEILKEGLKYRKERSILEAPRFSRLEKAVKIGGTLAPFASPILDSILIYKGYHLILDQNWPIPFIIVLAVAPGIYLQVKLSQKFYCQLFNRLTRLKPAEICRCPTDLKKTTGIALKYFLIGLLTILGLASDTTVVRDNIGFDSIFKFIFGVSVISTMAILLITSMNDMYKDMAGYFQKRKRTVEQIEYDSFLSRIDSVGTFFRQISTERFVSIVEDLRTEDFDIKYLNGDIKDIQGVKQLLTLTNRDDGEMQTLLTNTTQHTI